MFALRNPLNLLDTWKIWNHDKFIEFSTVSFQITPSVKPHSDESAMEQEAKWRNAGFDLLNNLNESMKGCMFLKISVLTH